MSAAIVPAAELAKRLGVSEIDLQMLAGARRLPFSFSTANGWFIRAVDAPLWEHAVMADRCATP